MGPALSPSPSLSFRPPPLPLSTLHSTWLMVLAPGEGVLPLSDSVIRPGNCLIAFAPKRAYPESYDRCQGRASHATVAHTLMDSPHYTLYNPRGANQPWRKIEENRGPKPECP